MIVGSLELKDRIRTNFTLHHEEISGSNHRFAVVGPTSVQYYDDRESLYAKHPTLKPDGTLYFGTKPLMVDIGKLNNSPEYQREQIEEEKKESR